MRPALLFVLVFSLALAGCAPGKSVIISEPAGFSSPEAALSAINPDRNGEKVFQVTAKVALSSPQGKMILKLAAVMQPPDKLRLESIPVLGPPDFFLTVKEGRFKVFLPGTPEFITGNAGADNLGRFLPLAWPADKWISVLTGTHPGTAGRTEQIHGVMEGPLYRIDVVGSDEMIRERLWINPGNRHLEMADFISADGRTNRVSYQWGLQSGNFEVPQVIKIDPGEGSRILITCTDFRIAGDPEPDLFDLPCPGEGIPVRRWD